MCNAWWAEDGDLVVDHDGKVILIGEDESTVVGTFAPNFRVRQVDTLSSTQWESFKRLAALWQDAAMDDYQADANYTYFNSLGAIR